MRAAAGSHQSSSGNGTVESTFQLMPYTRPDKNAALRGGASSSTAGNLDPTQDPAADHQSVDDFVRSFHAELALLRRTGEVQRQKQQSWNSGSALGTTVPSGQRFTQPGGSSTPSSHAEAPPTDHRDFLGLGIQVAEAVDGNLVISHILPHGPASGGQLQPGDTILGVDGQDPHSKVTIRGSTVNLHVRSRTGAIQAVAVQRVRRSSGGISLASQQHSGAHVPAASADGANGPKLSRPATASSGRTYPARALMQWDYSATREDEMTAKAGEVILITGEYKNAGWLWGSKISAGGVPAASSLLVPANYIAYLAATHPSSSAPPPQHSHTGPATRHVLPHNPPPTISVSPPQPISSSSNWRGPSASLSSSAPRDPGHSSASLSSTAASHADAVQEKPAPEPAPPPPPPAIASSGSGPADAPPSAEGSHLAALAPPGSDALKPPAQAEPDDVRDMMLGDVDGEEEGSEFVVGDVGDPILDGMYEDMYEDESGLRVISIHC